MESQPTALVRKKRDFRRWTFDDSFLYWGHNRPRFHLLILKKFKNWPWFPRISLSVSTHQPLSPHIVTGIRAALWDYRKQWQEKNEINRVWRAWNVPWPSLVRLSRYVRRPFLSSSFLFFFFFFFFFTATSLSLPFAWPYRCDRINPEVEIETSSHRNDETKTKKKRNADGGGGNGAENGHGRQ